MPSNRSQIADDIITVLKASTRTQLTAMHDKAISYGLRTFQQFFSVQYSAGIFVGVGSGPLEPLTMAAEQMEVLQRIELQVYVIGHDPETDQRKAVTIAEEIEEELNALTNLDLPNGGTFLQVSEFMPGPPVQKSEVTLHFVLMEVIIRKTVILTGD